YILPPPRPRARPGSDGARPADRSRRPPGVRPRSVILGLLAVLLDDLLQRFLEGHFARADGIAALGDPFGVAALALGLLTALLELLVGGGEMKRTRFDLHSQVGSFSQDGFGLLDGVDAHLERLGNRVAG